MLVITPLLLVPSYHFLHCHLFHVRHFHAPYYIIFRLPDILYLFYYFVIRGYVETES